LAESRKNLWRRCGLILMVALPCGAHAVQPTPARTILLLPLESKGGASRETAEVLTQMMAAEGSKSRNYKMVSFTEIQGTMSQEQVRQVSGCSSNTCAAEIAGALNTDEIVMGTFGKVGDSYVLTATRIRARDAQIVARISERFRDLDENKVLDRLPAVMQLLLTDEPVATGAEAPATPAPAAAVEERDVQSKIGPRVLMGAGAAGIAAGGAMLIAALAAAAGSGLSFVSWLTKVNTFALTGGLRMVVLTGLPLACAGGAALLLVLSAAGAVGGAAGLGIGLWWAP
jgi:hypothetical protein